MLKKRGGLYKYVRRGKLVDTHPPLFFAFFCNVETQCLRLQCIASLLCRHSRMLLAGISLYMHVIHTQSSNRSPLKTCGDDGAGGTCGDDSVGGTYGDDSVGGTYEDDGVLYFCITNTVGWADVRKPNKS